MNHILTQSAICQSGVLSDCSFGIISAKNLVINNPPIVIETTSTGTFPGNSTSGLELQNLNGTNNNIEQLVFNDASGAPIAYVSGQNADQTAHSGNLLFTVAKNGATNTVLKLISNGNVQFGGVDSIVSNNQFMQIDPQMLVSGSVSNIQNLSLNPTISTSISVNEFDNLTISDSKTAGTGSISKSVGLVINTPSSGTTNYSLQCGGGVIMNCNPITFITTNYQISVSDYYLFCSSASGSIVLTLPATVPPNGWTIWIKQCDVSVGTQPTIVINPGSNFIDGLTTYGMVTNRQSLCIASFSGNYWIISDSGLAPV